MKTYFRIALVLLGFLVYSLFPSLSLSKKNQTFQSEVWTQLFFVKCFDGDTCVVKNKEGIQLTLRLLGVDAPEIKKNRGPKKNRNEGQIYGAESKVFLEEKVVGKTFNVKLLGSDVYNRYLALIFESNSEVSSQNAKVQDAQSLNAKIIREGFAFAYQPPSTKYPPSPLWAVEAEKEAKKNKKGFWALSSLPENPSDFRKKHKTSKR